MKKEKRQTNKKREREEEREKQTETEKESNTTREREKQTGHQMTVLWPSLGSIKLHAYIHKDRQT